VAQSDPLIIYWFRRDLRLDDNTALLAASKAGLAILPIFIFDPNILRHLKLKDDRRITFIYDTLLKIPNLRIYFGPPTEIYEKIIAEFNVSAVYCNEDYEPYARERDSKIESLLKRKSIAFYKFKDHVIFSPNEVLKDDKTPYNVFTPYSRRWLTHFEDYLPRVQGIADQSKFLRTGGHENPSLADIGFSKNTSVFPNEQVRLALIENYGATRDFPAEAGTSRLGLHLRFGTISIRRLALAARDASLKFLMELIWREFYQMIIWHYPETVREPFNRIYKGMSYPGTKADFRRWADAETGYPLVDAGMRELLETGFMHNRVRMVVASFLTKHLLCDWRWGENFFAQYLLDFELASNVGGWQWAAGIGVDAAPYFRIFNPTEQQKKFDAKGEYVQRWLGSSDFFSGKQIEPMIDHRFARERCLEFFSAARHKK